MASPALDFDSVTDVLVHRDKLDIELPISLFGSFIGHFALIVFLSVFQGFNIFSKGESISLGGGSDIVTVSAIPLSAPPLEADAADLPDIEIPDAPEPEAIEFDEPALDIPDFDAEVDILPPTKEEPEKVEEKPEPTPVARVTPKAESTPKPKTTPRPKQTPKPAANPGRGALGLAAGSGVGGVGGGSGPPGDPGLSFYAERVTSLIAEVWHQPYVNAPPGTLLECVIFFSISRDGITRDHAVETSSGIPNMDKSALRAVIDAGQLPPLPPTYRGSELTVSFQFQYRAGQ